MPLRNEDKVWIATEIQNAVNTLRPHGWRKAVSALRELGPLATIIGVFVALLAITIGSVYQVAGHVKEETQFRTNTGDRLGGMETRLTSMEATILGLRTSQASQDPAAPHSIAEVKNVLAVARNAKIKIDDKIVEDAGAKFIEAASHAPQAWDGVLELPFGADSFAHFEHGFHSHSL